MKFCLTLIAVFLVTGHTHAQSEKPKPDMEARLKQLLERNPTADTNKDGTLTREEVKAFSEKRKNSANNRSQADRRSALKPTHANVKYGEEHERQRFDLYLAPRKDDDAPNPLAIYIHGGGFRGGTKKGVAKGAIDAYHAAGISVAAIEYRLSDVGPYPIMMHDAARCLQTIRHRADEWHIDPERIGCYGGSAGAGISLWLAFHDDLANPDSDDPIAHQSTRILAAGTINGQSTYDMKVFREWFGVAELQPHPALIPFYAIENPEDEKSERVRNLMTDASAMTHLDKDDIAPVYAEYRAGDLPVDAATNPSIWVHHVKLGLKLQQAMHALDRECIVRSPDHIENDPYGSMESFFIKKLKGK